MDERGPDTGEVGYEVVVNLEEQYSIWPVWRTPPDGWRRVGVSGSEEACLQHIESVWTDMRPLSLRRALEGSGATAAAVRARRAGTPGGARDVRGGGESQDPMRATDDLPSRLARDSHALELCLGRVPNLEELVAQVKAGTVHVEFTETAGGTTLTLTLDAEDAAALTESVEQLVGGETDDGRLSIAGDGLLDNTAVRCRAVVDAKTFRGRGSIAILQVAVRRPRLAARAGAGGPGDGVS